MLHQIRTRIWSNPEACFPTPRSKPQTIPQFPPAHALRCFGDFMPVRRCWFPHFIDCLKECLSSRSCCVRTETDCENGDHPANRMRKDNWIYVMINETIADIRDETIRLGHDKPQGGSKSGLVIFDIIMEGWSFLILF